MANIKNRHVKYLGINLSLFAYYAGELSIVLWLASALILSAQVRRFPNWLLAYTIALTFFFGFRMLLDPGSAEDTLRDARFFWGFMFFLPFFVSEQRRLGCHFAEYESFFRLFVNLSLVLLLIEFLTANALSVEWPNRSHELSIEIESGSLARSYGFGGNATVTSVLLIALGGILYAGRFMRDIATLGLATSGTGFLTLLLKSALMLKARHLLIGAAIFVVIYSTVWVGVLESGVLDAYSAFGKFSLDYIGVLLDVKYEQYQSVMARTNDFQLVFGQPFTELSLRTGDTQLLDFFTFNGLFGVGMLVLIVVKCMNKTNRVPLFLVLVATSHYQVIFSLPGQILFAWLLTVGTRVPQRRCKSADSMPKDLTIEPYAVRG